MGNLAYQLFCTPPRTKRSVVKKAAGIFASVEVLTLNDENRALRAYRWTPPQSGGSNGCRTVMLVHGWGGSAHSMQFFVEPLLQRGFHVVAFDAPAHGASSGFQTTLLKSAESLKRVAAEVASPYAIIGHSFGGVVGAVAVSGREEHELDDTKRLVVISSPNRLTDVLTRFGAELHVAPASIAFMTKRIEKVAGRPIEALSTGSFVAASGLPAMVIHDKNDKEVPVADGSAIAAGSPGTRFVMTAGLGHRRILLSRFVVDAVADFLKGENENAAGEEIREEIRICKSSSSI